MKVFPVLALLLFVMTNCSKTHSAENRSNDSIPITDSLHITAEEGDIQFGYPFDSEPVAAGKIDTTTTLVITTNCVVMMNETASQAAAREEEEAREYAKAREAALREWESQPHDSTETFEYYPEFNGDTGYYQSEASRILNELYIPVIVVEEKEFILLKKINGESLLVNVRNEFNPEWDLILFHVEKKPVKTDMMAVSSNSEAVKNYFFH